MASRLYLFIACAGLPMAALAQEPWFEQAGVRERLLERQIVVRKTAPEDAARGSVSAAVFIAAPPEAIWIVMTDCARAPSFVPGLKLCRVLDAAQDASWEILEHEVKYSRLLPAVRYVFRADYSRPRSILFHRVSGDLREQEGEWRLEPTADVAGTIVAYQVHLDPGFFIPQGVVRHALRQDVPALLGALRSRVEQPPKLAPR